MITQDEAIALAQYVGAELFKNSDNYVVFSPEELTAFANELREHTLLEAADEFGRIWTQTLQIQKELRRMAGVE